MKLKELKNDYYQFSLLASSINRQLAFAGFGLIWIFKNQTTGKIILPDNLRYAALFLVLSMSLDFIQYVYATFMTGYHHRKLEKTFSEEDNIKITKYFNWPTNSCFVIKILSMVVAYIFVIAFLLDNLK